MLEIVAVGAIATQLSCACRAFGDAPAQRFQSSAADPVEVDVTAALLRGQSQRVLAGPRGPRMIPDSSISTALAPPRGSVEAQYA